MKLESLLKPVKFVDEQILRQYTKLTNKWEDKGHSKYGLANIANYSSLVPSMVSTAINLSFNPQFSEEVSRSFSPPNLYEVLLVVATPLMIYTHDFLLNAYLSEKNEGLEEGSLALDRFEFYSRKFQNAVRLPLFSLATLSLGVGINEIIETGEIVRNLGGLAVTAGFLYPLASSMYIKDSDPKLLDKAPFWKSASDWVKEKAKSLNPLPQPIPETQSAYSTNK